jgi:hypothetical protein
MDYSQNVKRLRMKAVLDSIDGGNAPGTIELRDADRVVLATLLLSRPSFYLVGADLQMVAPTTTIIQITGRAAIGSITDGSGTIVIDNMTVGVDPTLDETHDFEIVLDTVDLEQGKQVTIATATIEHG